jgi:hypothetical protein
MALALCFFCLCSSCSTHGTTRPAAAGVMTALLLSYYSDCGLGTLFSTAVLHLLFRRLALAPLFEFFCCCRAGAAAQHMHVYMLGALLAAAELQPSREMQLQANQ